MPAGRLHVVDPGPTLVAALRSVLEDVRGGDPLAAVDVVVPTAVAGVTLRRAVAGDGGLANVRFTSLPQLAERLAARPLALSGPAPRLPVSTADRRRAVLAALRDGGSHLAHAAIAHQATVPLVEGVLRELDAVDLRPHVRLTTRGHEVVDLHRAYRGHLGDAVLEREVLEVAAQALVDDAPTTVVLILTGRLTAADRTFLTAVHDAGRLNAVASTTAPEGERQFLRSLLGGPEPPPANSPTGVSLVAAPDSEEEVRIAVRRVLRHLEAHGCRPERIGIAVSGTSPYVRLLREQLRAAGLPHHVPRTRTLAQTVSGRTLLGLLDAAAHGYPRVEVLDWLADGPRRTRDGDRVPAARWDRLSREAGVSRGLDSWRDRTARAVSRAAQRAAEQPEHAERYRDRAQSLLTLLATVEDAAAHADAVRTAESWSGASGAATALLQCFLGSSKDVDRWTSSTAAVDEAAAEQQAHDAVLAAVADLRRRDELDRPSDGTAVVEALRDALDAPLPSGTTLGRGVLVAQVDQFTGADLDLLLVLGMAEGALPRSPRQHPVLRDDDRAALSPELATVQSRRADARTAWDAVLRSAGEVVLSYPRSDSRSQRRTFPSPWFLEQAERLAGRPVSAGELDAGSSGLDAQPWFTSVPSFVAGLHGADVHASLHELDVALALDGHIDALAAQDARLARGLAAARARGVGEAGAWTGVPGPLPPAVREDVDQHLSASSLQRYATCPASHFFGDVLGVRELEDRAAEDTVDAREKGGLFHEVLEVLVGDHLGDPRAPGIEPSTPWSDADVARAHALLDHGAAELEAQGLTGRPVLWRVQLAQLHRVLDRVLAADTRRRGERRSWPVAVEAPFGRDGVPDLVLDLPTQGPVRFAGYVDRIDATADGGLVVLDYKTGGGYGYDVVPLETRSDPDADLVDRGRKLQLLLYALAARDVLGLPDAPVDSWYWIVEKAEVRGGRITAAHEQRARQVLDVVVGGIRDGIAPAYPGGESWRAGSSSWDNCRFCAFDRVCPTTRAEQWRALSHDDRVRPYARVADPEQENA